MTINLYNPFNLVYMSFQSVPIIVYFMWSDLYRTWRVLFYNSAKLPPGFHSAINFQRFRETFLNIQRLYQFILTYNQLHHRTIATSNHMVYLSTSRIRYLFSAFLYLFHRRKCLALKLPNILSRIAPLHN